MPKRSDTVKAFVKSNSEVLYYIGYSLLIITFFAKDTFRDSLKDKIQDQSTAVDRHKAAAKRIEDKENVYITAARFEQATRLPKNQPPDLDDFAKGLSHKMEQAVMYVADAVEFAREAPHRELAARGKDLQQRSDAATASSYTLMHQVVLMNGGQIPRPLGDEETKYMARFNDAVHSESELINESVQLTGEIEEDIRKTQEAERARLAKTGIVINVLFCLGWVIGLIGHIAGLKDLPGPV